MDFEEYEDKIKEKLKIELEKILSREDLCVEEIQFLDGIVAHNKMKKLANII